ncbi:nuclear fragile X mental retardation protein interacting protein 1 [Tyrophagus putrescentiae]|nr:nuclear fragile X mental retardation protein interacting protein 1 [Tyrophagus putrescentiae]
MIPKPSFLQAVTQPSSGQLNHQHNGDNMKHYQKRFTGQNNFGSSRGRGARFNRHHDRNNTNNGEVRCNFKGCRFSGPPDVVKFHSDVQHIELRNKYSVDFSLSTPEDIAKWRSERRARYPTFENVVKKSSEQLNNEADNRKATHFNQSNNSDNYSSQNRQNWKNSENNRSRYNDKRKFNSNNALHQNFTDHHYNVKRNRTEDVSATSDPIPQMGASEVKSVVKEEVKVEPSVCSNSLNLLTYYESDEEAEVSPPDEQKSTENVEEAVKEVVSELLCKVEKTVFNSSKQKTSKRQKKKAKKQPPSGPQLNFSRLSLFQKLMLQDVRKVKTDFVECLQLIVNNNFLQNK